MATKQFNNSYDAFRSFLVENSDYEGYIELPKIKTSSQLPDKVITFSKALLKTWKDFDYWVVFYEHDIKFERLWHNPKQYLARLKKFKGIISPDFSLYRNMPLCMQIWNTYRGRALSAWLQNNGVEVIPNVRFNDKRTYKFCFDGIEKFKTVAVGTHGCIKAKLIRIILKTVLRNWLKSFLQKQLLCTAAHQTTFLKNTGIWA